jgi:GNAT superfamily N-acetyltransferase
MESGKQWWIADEFCSMLDRETAKIVAFNIQKIARQMHKAVIVATTHKDLFEDLNPSVQIHKQFGKEIVVNYYSNEPAEECSATKEMKVKLGTLDDWRSLASFHYRSHRVGAVRKVFCLMRASELCGVIVYCYPPPNCFGRSKVLPKMNIQELNGKLSVIMRVVVHPKYRTIGLGSKLVHDTLPLAGTPFVEMVAVMAKYNPFAEKAGMQKIIEQPPSKEASQVSEVLSRLGFNLQLLGSEGYVKEKLEALTTEQLATLKEAFIKNGHPRFMKEFGACQNAAYGKKADYVEGIKDASRTKMAKLIKIVSVLLQTKIYLFWQNPAF